MPPGKPKSARAVAIDVLSRFDPARDYAGPILNDLLSQTAEKQRATDLVFGTLRNRHAIDKLIAAFSSRRTDRIPTGLLNILRVAVYEIVYRPETPDYSIVNEAAENAGTLQGKKQVGFVNAILRNITRHIVSRQTRLTDADVRTTLPQTPSTGCTFDTPFMPDVQLHPADYLSAAFSLPLWLINDWRAEFGLEKTRQICFASNRRPSIYIRPNPLKTSAEDLAQLLHQADIDFEIAPPDIYRASAIENRVSGLIRIRSGSAVTQLPGFAEGLFTVQDLAASQAIIILNPQPGWKILDLCAAPGTKTAQLAEMTDDSAEIIATDADSERLKKVKQNIARLRITSVTVLENSELSDNSKFNILNSKLSEPDPFDAVLLDVPCSNTGVLARRVEARYRLNPAAIRDLTATQSQLLRRAAPMLRTGGKICYSTCSIQKAENSDLIRTFLQENHCFELESQEMILPFAAGSDADSPAEKKSSTFDHDGGYVAILIRTKPIHNFSTKPILDVQNLWATNFFPPQTQ